MKLALLTLAVCVLIGCHSESPENNVLYTSDAFSVYKDSVVQGKNIARVLSPTHIQSNYKSPAGETFSRLIFFKVSVNEKDNELPPGSEHWVVIGDEHESPVYTFGTPPPPQPERPDTYLPANYEYTFRFDMTPVIKQFEEKGYYEGWDGSKVAKAELKGFYLAGGSLPLSWDFVGLEEKGLKLQPTGEGNIYSVTLKMNPYNEADTQEKEWTLSADLSKRPQYHSDQPLVDALFNLSTEEATKNIEPDSTFRTGAKWGGVWTRDISYSIFLAFAYHEPEVGKISLRKKVKRGRIVQDTGSGGAWPVSSDRTTWVMAAWEIYKVTGDQAWLDEVYPIIKNSLEDDYKNLYDPATGMYRGESSFLDWREQTYPKWMSNMDIAVSENLGTNAIHYRAHRILAEMTRLKGESGDVYDQRAESIRKGINQYLWMADQGYYAQYLYGRPNLTISPRSEALGEALSVLFGVADEERAASVLSKSPVTDYGISCIYPQIPGIPPYHNNAIWPFVQSYWNLAAARTGNEMALQHGLAAIYRACAFFLSNYENMVAQTGDFLGTEINSDRMLWSMAGNLAMVYRVLIGMSFETDGLHFSPAIPAAYGGTQTLSNFKYRQATLNITVKGHGHHIERMLMDGTPVPNHMVPADLTGTHSIEIEMDNAPFPYSAINLVANHVSLPTPRAHVTPEGLTWSPVKEAVSYKVYRNGAEVAAVPDTIFKAKSEGYAEYKVCAIDREGYASFTSEPQYIGPAPLTFEMENFAPASRLPFTDFSGKGFVETTIKVNPDITCKIDIQEAGDYLLDVRYSNGSGHWNTDNMCAVRTLSVNDTDDGSLVLPQRGLNEWSDWSYSNSQRVHLQQGMNTIRIRFAEWNYNMNVDINTAMLDQIRLFRLN